MVKTRTEKDSLGTKEIPEHLYYGVQTLRAVENFPVSGLHAHPRLIDVYVMIKKAAAFANAKAGELSKEHRDAIVKACDEVLGGQLRDQFPVDVFQMGAGTAFNMNVNEVLANRANEILGQPKGAYKPINPNDHVNMGQSTNDTFPTAVRVAALLILKENLHGPLEQLERSFEKKAKEFDTVIKSARTHLQDAVPIRLGQEFAAYAECLKKCRLSLMDREKAMLELGLGGSAAGTGLNTAHGYREEIISELAKLSGLPLVPAKDMREAMQSQRPIAEVSSGLKNLCLELTRILNDLRLMSSGPTTGFAEILLPATAPGSSIMPGKVNPSILEMVNMVAFHVIGSDAAISMGVQAGQLELNVMMPLMTYELNFSISILGNGMKILAEKCVDGITANVEKCRHYAENSMGIATALNAYIGYAQAAEVVKEATRTGKSIPQIIREKKILTDERYKEVMDPYKMTEPGIPGKD